MTNCLYLSTRVMIEEGNKISGSLKGTIVFSQDVASKEGKLQAIKNLYKDKPLVLFFYPRDMTPGCTTEARSFRDSYQQIQQLGAEVAGCSRDTVSSHCRFMEKNELPYPLISDEDGSISEAFGVWQEKKMYGKSFMGIVRSTFIIEKGKIIKAFHRVKPKTHVQEVIDFLKTRNKE